jgi:KUP system potassium uptake protein
VRKESPLDQTGEISVASASGAPPSRRLALLVLGALGVVYGDIGTSPLYAVKECFDPASPHAVPVTDANILGVLSLVFWALAIIISLKYVIFVMRADNRGEGGVLALMALVLRKSDKSYARTRWIIITMGLFGAALLYGDGMITPAISVLSAVEGLNVATSFFKDRILLITVVILAGLFLMQSRGTHKLGRMFGPIVLVWFTVMGVLGVHGMLKDPTVLRAIDPVYGLSFLVHGGWAAFIALSSVFLAVTGGEALYADMGHFGRRPIRIGWYVVALPSLLLNYFGQGALLLREGESVASNPFYHLAPKWALIPLVVLATAATVVASQAVISGAFSLTRQAIQLGFLPRYEIRHTSSHEIGQIYVPQVNWMLAAFTIILVLTFKTSTNLAGAYGLAVSLTMVITTILLFFLARRLWGWSLPLTYGVLGALIAVDLVFLGSNLTKIAAGGWFPLVMAAIVFTLMTTWRRGRELTARRLEDRALPVEMFIADVAQRKPTRVPGVSVFMTGSLSGTPVALLHNVKNNHVVHETVVLLSVNTEEVPHVPPRERIAVESLEQGFHRVTARYGFMDTPDVQQVLDHCRSLGYNWSMGKTTFFLGRTTLIPKGNAGMALWRKKIFVVMSRNAERATAFFRIPPGRVVELGLQVEL